MSDTSGNSKQAGTYDLRREAGAIRVERLTKSQQEALSRILAYLERASTLSAESVTNRKSRLLLLSGDRGSGKTSLVLTLSDWFAAQTINAPVGSDPEAPGKFKEQIKTLAKSVQWLEPLSLDPLPRGTNLLGAVLARIDTAVQARHSDPRAVERGLFDPVDAIERARHELTNLRSEAVIALEGNLKERAPGMDPDGFAISANHAEYQKLRLAAQLNRILSRIAAKASTDPGTEKKVYVLPVDDIDVRPSRAIEMLKLAYLLSIPRLFFVFLGSHAVLDQVLFYETQGEFQGLLGDGAGDSATMRDQIEISSNEIASSLLRKLIPPEQRIAVTGMSLDEACGYTGEGGGAAAAGTSTADRRDLRVLLGNIRWDLQMISTLDPARKEGTPNQVFSDKRGQYSLGQLLGIPATGDGSVGVHGKSYDGVNFFAASPRQVADLHQALAQFVPQEDKKTALDVSKSNKLFDKLANNFRSLVDEDAHLTVPVQGALKAMFHEHRDGAAAHATWELDLPAMQIAFATGDALTLQPKGLAEVSVHPCKVMARRVRHHDVQASAPGSDGFKSMAPPTRAAFKLIHDLMLLSDHGRIGAPLRYTGESSVAMTIWDDGVSEPLQIPWSVSRWQSFWHLDVFSSYWNQGVKAVSDARRQKAEMKDGDFLVALGLFWVSSVVNTVLARPGGKPEEPSFLEEKKGGKGWSFVGDEELRGKTTRLAERIEGLATHARQRREEGCDDLEADLIDAMLVELACLAMPEVGLVRFSRFSEDEKESEDRGGGKEGKEPPSDQKHSYAGEALRTLLLSVLRNDYVKKELDRSVARKRLDRIGEHIGTMLGFSFAAPGRLIDRKANLNTDSTVVESGAGRGTVGEEPKLFPFLIDVNGVDIGGLGEPKPTASPAAASKGSANHPRQNRHNKQKEREQEAKKQQQEAEKQQQEAEKRQEKAAFRRIYNPTHEEAQAFFKRRARLGFSNKIDVGERAQIEGRLFPKVDSNAARPPSSQGS